MYLEVNSFVGYDPFASHYYGTLTWYDAEDKRHTHDVEHAINATEARLFNQKDRMMSYRQGRMTERFTSEKAVIKQAIITYQELGGTELVLGSIVIADEQPIIHKVDK
jgi:hypothetical protein